MRSEISTEIQYSYTKSLVLETFLTPHSSLLTPLKSLHVLMQTLFFILFCARFTLSLQHKT